MSSHDSISTFLTAVRARLDTAWLVKVFSITLAGVAAALCLACLYWIWRGYSVPIPVYTAAIIALPLISALAWILGRASAPRAARVADEHFGLKDGIASHLGFSKKGSKGEFIELQSEDTASRIASLSARSIPITWPKRLLSVAGALVLASVLMAFKAPSSAALDQLALEKETLSKTEEIQEELKKQVEELIASATDEEKELIQPDEWQQWLKELKETGDPKEAMRQYAALEQKLAESVRKLDQRNAEQLLARAGEELQQEAELCPLAQSLQQKEYRQAAQQLGDMALKADVRKPDEARKELARLKAASQRMAAAARQHQQRSGQNSKSNNSSQASSSSSGKQGQSQNQGQGQSSGSGEGQGSTGLADQMTDLEQAVQDLDRKLQQSNSDPKLCEQSQKDINDKLASLCKGLRKCEGQRSMSRKLQKLSQCVGQCQGYLGNRSLRSLSQSISPNSGGKKAGQGGAENRPDGSDQNRATGNQEQLVGQKGSGPSQSTVESADSGSASVASARSTAERTYQRQMESFVQREDVPGEVRDGVREYFKGIGELSEDTIQQE